jgi:protein-disulfide isomerase
MKRFLPFLLILAVGACAIAGGILFYRAQERARVEATRLQVGAEEGARHMRGPGNAAVVLVEFGDFQCPPCGGLSEPLNELEKENPSQLRIVFRQLPLEIHQHAREAAYASEAAALQGHFWEMHDLLYREQATWSKAADVTPLFEGYATKIGLNLERYRADVSSVGVKALVMSDEKRAAINKVEATPSIFINDKLVPPASLHPADLRALVQVAIKKSSVK